VKTCETTMSLSAGFDTKLTVTTLALVDKSPYIKGYTLYKGTIFE